MKTQKKKPQNSKKDSKDKITVQVYAPRSLDSKEFTWKKNRNVGDAAKEAADAFGYEPEKPPRLQKDDDILDNTKNLVSEGVREGDELELVGGGGGVSSN
ncbi:hypothetical protein [Fodinibius salsisoli]|uniref:Ubiquitin-like domain-containing protein n=1 Tax=Fodinibius salsisoli TaxID=2820877 RepID=A0ABT3PT30_9BACT|nr:hypothetical protein [Fodinibius salsisoli]MCW9709024.1 hypothetical protein [Fodinibius salsisoli]